jgi:hypothetical protein
MLIRLGQGICVFLLRLLERGEIKAQVAVDGTRSEEVVITFVSTAMGGTNFALVRDIASVLRLKLSVSFGV